ncbi:MAG: hypothetical protein LBT32_07900 [Peptococcaceae bacterium]|jgi:hypothetical protein|nr:hypothetical protein [Peptococcaceae bacterium]
MLFPFPTGELILLTAALLGWTEQIKDRWRLYALCLAWIAGAALEGYWQTGVEWHWNWARFAVLFLFWRWAWGRARRRVIPLLCTVAALFVRDVFLLNEPGILIGTQWLFSIGAVFVAAFISYGYWETLAAITGAWLMDPFFIRFLYSDIWYYGELPDPFAWHFCAVVCAGLTVMRYLFRRWVHRGRRIEGA